MNDLQVQWWPIDKPIPYARNSHNIPQTAIYHPGAQMHTHRNLHKCR